MQVNWIEEYKKEVGPPLEFDQFAENADTQNIWVDGVCIGIIVYTTTMDTISIHVMWVKKEYRNQLKEACRYLANWIKDEQMYNFVEIIADLRVAKWLERYLKLKVKQKIYEVDINKLVSVLEEK
jgi:hypothetical protein|tara:strand:- start:1367 stop:1741 length:375 start_codon:yes stop_codon:yes gene_type:complete